MFIALLLTVLISVSFGATQIEIGTADGDDFVFFKDIDGMNGKISTLFVSKNRQDPIFVGNAVYHYMGNIAGSGGSGAVYRFDEQWPNNGHHTFGSKQEAFDWIVHDGVSAVIWVDIPGKGQSAMKLPISFKGTPTIADNILPHHGASAKNYDQINSDYYYYYDNDDDINNYYNQYNQRKIFYKTNRNRNKNRNKYNKIHRKRRSYWDY